MDITPKRALDSSLSAPLWRDEKHDTEETGLVWPRQTEPPIDPGCVNRGWSRGAVAGARPRRAGEMACRGGRRLLLDSHTLKAQEET